MNDIADIEARLGELWIPTIYREKIRPLRTRSVLIEVSERANDPEILHTLLGVELKVGRVRIACPELSTARYLMVFARIGCRDVAIPYDITAIPGLADLLETAWHRMMIVIEGITKRKQNAVIKHIRLEIAEIGAGAAMPAFDTLTRMKDRR